MGCSHRLPYLAGLISKRDIQDKTSYDRTPRCRGVEGCASKVLTGLWWLGQGGYDEATALLRTMHDLQMQALGDAHEDTLHTAGQLAKYLTHQVCRVFHRGAFACACALTRCIVRRQGLHKEAASFLDVEESGESSVDAKKHSSTGKAQANGAAAVANDKGPALGAKDKRSEDPDADDKGKASGAKRMRSQDLDADDKGEASGVKRMRNGKDEQGTGSVQTKKTWWWW